MGGINHASFFTSNFNITTEIKNINILHNMYIVQVTQFHFKINHLGGGGDGIINYSFVPWSTLFNPHVKADHGLCDPLQGLDPSCSHLKLFHIWPGDQNYD